MRIRSVRPDFWSDETLGRLPDSVRLFYIGLWCIADDAGWFEWRPAQVGATLYPYRPIANRERNIKTWSDALVAAGRLVLHPCGCGFIPTLAKHQRQIGNPSYQYREKHRYHGLDEPESRQVRTDTPLGDSRVGDSRVGEGISTGARAKAARADSHDEWERKVVEMRRRGAR